MQAYLQPSLGASPLDPFLFFRAESCTLNDLLFLLKILGAGCVVTKHTAAVYLNSGADQKVPLVYGLCSGPLANSFILPEWAS